MKKSIFVAVLMAITLMLWVPGCTETSPFGNVKTDNLTDMTGANKKKDNGPFIVLSVAFLVAAGIGVFYFMRKKAEKSEDDIDVDDLPDVDLDDDDDKF